jgi:hypothetical protein
LSCAGEELSPCQFGHGKNPVVSRGVEEREKAKDCAGRSGENVKVSVGDDPLQGNSSSYAARRFKKAALTGQPGNSHQRVDHGTEADRTADGERRIPFNFSERGFHCAEHELAVLGCIPYRIKRSEEQRCSRNAFIEARARRLERIMPGIVRKCEGAPVGSAIAITNGVSGKVACDVLGSCQ